MSKKKTKISDILLKDVALVVKKLTKEDFEKPKQEIIEPVIHCPVCKSTNIEDNSIRQDNGIIGPGYASWKVTDTRCCKDCGVIFKITKNNGL
jgi:hypothetical protein